MTWTFHSSAAFDVNDLKALFQCGKEKKLNFWIQLPGFNRQLWVDKGVFKLNDLSQNSWRVIDDIEKEYYQ